MCVKIATVPQKKWVGQRTQGHFLQRIDLPGADVRQRPAGASNTVSPVSPGPEGFAPPSALEPSTGASDGVNLLRGPHRPTDSAGHLTFPSSESRSIAAAHRCSD